MEHLRVFLAIALSFLVFFLWSTFFVDNEAVNKKTQKSQEVAKVEAPVEKKDEGSAERTIEPQQKKIFTGSQKEEGIVLKPRVFHVKTPFYEVMLNEKGALIEGLLLNNYREAVNPDSPRKELILSQYETYAGRIDFANNAVPEIKNAVFHADIEDEKIEVNEGTRAITFKWKSSYGLVVEKTYAFSADTYLIEMEISVKNETSIPFQHDLIVGMRRYFKKQNGRYGFTGPSALVKGKLKQVKIGDIEDENTVTGPIKWAALQDRYFLAAIIPRETVETRLWLSQKDKTVVSARYIQPVETIQPGADARYEYDLFFGPKSMKVLEGMPSELEKVINFGMFNIIAKPCLFFMNWLYDNVVKNYGIAIIILTLVTKILLWPLGNKSYKSMNAMKKLQPLMTEIREKYKHDKKQMNQEMMALYKTYKVNPMGGCLPMVLQIPVFIALYRMLYEAIELRHAPFFLWINDLAAPDRLFRFDFSIPFMQPPYGIPVLTLVMGATMLLQQKMSPPPGDPTQAKMMLFMPLIFTVIFINFSSGLVLYWLVNNIFSIAQQYYISKRNA